MKIFISEKNEEIENKFLRFDLSENIESADSVVIVPHGGMESFFCLLKGIDLGKDVYISNDDNSYNNVIDRLNKMIAGGTIKLQDGKSMIVEENIDDVIERMEEKENDKSNDGKISQLL